MKRAQLDSFLARLDIDDLLVMNAQRKSYGQMPKQLDLYADTSIAALWTWELASPSLYLESAHLKKVLSLRHSMSQQGHLIQSLAKLLKTIGKAKAASDLAKIQTRHATYVKAIQKRNEATSKLREKQLKEKIRLQEEEEKKR